MSLLAFVIILFPGQVLVVVARQRSRLELTNGDNSGERDWAGAKRECDYWSLDLSLLTYVERLAGRFGAARTLAMRGPWTSAHATSLLQTSAARRFL